MNVNNILVFNPSIVCPFITRWKFSLRIFWILSFIFIVSLLLFYIFQINEITKAGFFVSSYQKQLTELSQENKELEINFSQVNSLVNLETRLKNSNYERVDKIHYIRVLESTVVTK